MLTYKVHDTYRVRFTSVQGFRDIYVVACNFPHAYRVGITVKRSWEDSEAYSITRITREEPIITLK